MAKSIKSMRDTKRNEYMEIVKEMLENFGEEVLVTKSNTMAFPILLEDGTEDFLRIVLSVPTGTKDDPYDAYGEAESYQMHLKEKAEKEAEVKAKKEAKAKKDAERRAKAKAIHEGKGE